MAKKNKKCVYFKDDALKWLENKMLPKGLSATVDEVIRQQMKKEGTNDNNK